VFDYVTIGVADLATSTRFYDGALAALSLSRHAAGGFVEWGDLSIACNRPLTENVLVGLAAPTEHAVDAFHAAALAAGGVGTSKPGRWHVVGPEYAARVRDPDGVELEALARPEAQSRIAYVVLGVTQLEASRRLYETVLETLALGVHAQDRDTVSFGGADSSLRFEAASSPTRALHVAFAAGSNDDVDGFWRAGIDAGFSSNGEPGERPAYHGGYYAAYLLDPHGNNVEAVCHNR
jgi:predicted lactoylglutathione lyase